MCIAVFQQTAPVSVSQLVSQAMKICLDPGDLSSIATAVVGILQPSRNPLAVAGSSSILQALFSAVGDFVFSFFFQYNGAFVFLFI